MLLAGCPFAGLTKLAPAGGSGSSSSAVKDAVVSAIPLGRMGAKWDIAMACVFLASPAARFISGDTLVVDGAAWLWKPPILAPADVSRVSRNVEGASRGVGVASKL